MKFITLNRQYTLRSCYNENFGVYDSEVLKPRPITINPEYIISMAEIFDNGEFDNTQINVVGSTYHVLHRIDEIIEMINVTKEDN